MKLPPMNEMHARLIRDIFKTCATETGLDSHACSEPREADSKDASGGSLHSAAR